MTKKITRGHLEKFLRSYATDARTLDIGSGGSSYGRFFPNRVTVDIDPARKPEIVADAHALPFTDGEFEAVLCTEVLEHVRDPFQVERELRRVTRAGGMLVLSTRFAFPLHDTPHDYWRFTKYGLRELFKEWEIVELREETKTFSAVAALLQRISFQTELRMNTFSKVFLLCLTWLFDHLNWLIMKEYGNIQRSREEGNILTTGYYIACRKLPA
ncbi:MAG: type 11 methyltransferase [Parcubacteria group bacterium]|nr:type 11 methyltransferase [Parcubacteria group bacterium]